MKTNHLTRYDTIIIGAGPAGLSAAYELCKQNKRVVVLEAHPSKVGGISRTENWNGFRFDIGGHRFFSKSKKISELWNELLPNDFLTRNRLSRVYFNKRFFFYPLRPANVLRTLGAAESVRCLFSFLHQKCKASGPIVSFEDWVVKAFGRRLYSIFFKSYTEKVWGLKCTQISADWAAQRIRGLSFSVAIQFMFAPFRSKENVRTLSETFKYPRLGPGMMWEKASELVTALGGEIRMGERATCLLRPSLGHAWRVRSTSDSGETVFEADSIITSAPLRETFSQLEPAPSFQALKAASSLKYRDFLTVVIKTKGPEIFADHWIYVHDPGVRVGRIQNFKAWSPALVPDSQYGLYGLEYFCNEHDSLWELSDTELIEKAKTELVQIGLAQPENLIDGHVCRQPKAYPVYDHDYRANVAIIRKELESLPGLQTVGRNGMHRYNNQDHSMLTGLLAAKNVLGESTHDLWSVNEDNDYLEEAVSSRNKTVSSCSGERWVPQPL